MNTAFRLLLTFNATSLLIIIFLVHKGQVLSEIFGGIAWLSFTAQLPNAVSYIFYLLIPIFTTRVTISLSSFLGKDSFDIGEVECVEHANNSFLPSYLGYFFCGTEY